MGRLASGTVLSMIKIAPVKIPLLPRPAIARPTMSMLLLRAAPQTILPNSKRKMPDRKTGFVGKKVYILPYSRMKPAAVSMYALPYHPMSPMLSNSFVMAGIAGPMMVLSRATRKIEMYSDSIMTAVFAVDGYGDGVVFAPLCRSMSATIGGLRGSSFAELASQR
ncbi:hypothetical protein CUC08_Gglean003981 [Alternaria sp. MG1]|nr:hypothetical protein CUC08_Gglean003981 [Alternaria sp. MG1]